MTSFASNKHFKEFKRRDSVSHIDPVSVALHCWVSRFLSGIIFIQPEELPTISLHQVCYRTLSLRCKGMALTFFYVILFGVLGISCLPCLRTALWLGCAHSLDLRGLLPRPPVQWDRFCGSLACSAPLWPLHGLPRAQPHTAPDPGSLVPDPRSATGPQASGHVRLGFSNVELSGMAMHFMCVRPLSF